MTRLRSRHERKLGRIYISGPISYNPTHARGCFASVESFLRRSGYEDIINPEKTLRELARTMSHEELMRICRTFVELCDTVVLIDGWEKSLGASMEAGMALALGKDVYVLNENGTMTVLNY